METDLLLAGHCLQLPRSFVQYLPLGLFKAKEPAPEWENLAGLIALQQWLYFVRAAIDWAVQLGEQQPHVRIPVNHYSPGVSSSLGD